MRGRHAPPSHHLLPCHRSIIRPPPPPLHSTSAHRHQPRCPAITSIIHYSYLRFHSLSPLSWSTVSTDLQLSRGPQRSRGAKDVNSATCCLRWTKSTIIPPLVPLAAFYHTLAPCCKAPTSPTCCLVRVPGCSPEPSSGLGCHLCCCDHIMLCQQASHWFSGKSQNAQPYLQ